MQYFQRLASLQEAQNNAIDNTIYNAIINAVIRIERIKELKNILLKNKYKNKKICIFYE